MSMLIRLWRNSAFRFGTVVLGLLLLLAAGSPLLGTVDPSAMDSSNINTAWGARGNFALLDGTTGRLLYVTTCPAQALAVGGTVSIAGWSVEIGAPA